MATAIAITLTDSGATDFVFNPLSITPRQSLYLNRDSESAVASEKITLGLNPSSKSRQTDHVTARFDMPFEALVDGKYVVTDAAIFECKFTIPSALTSTNRADLLAKVRDLLGDVVVTTLVGNLEPPF